MVRWKFNVSFDVLLCSGRNANLATMPNIKDFIEKSPFKEKVNEEN
jgi:hypothetical protein